jgi:hypothetical protein
MAIGSEGEIGVEFRTGSKDIHYPWIVDGVQRQLMHGDSKLCFIAGRPDNIYPADGDFVCVDTGRGEEPRTVIEKPHDALGMGYLD